jgi:hypothetical protein
MPALRVTNFLGIAPKIAPELLPDTAAQIAKNVKLTSGDLIPYPETVIAGTTARSGDVKTIYPLRDPSNGSLVWLSWLTDVDIAVATSTLNEDQRFYYTGDGIPKVSNYSLATSGVAPYPIGYYDLGLPLPNTELTAVATTFTTINTSSYIRDAGGVVTIVTATPHGLRTGNSIIVSGFDRRVGSYSQTGNTITVTINNHRLSSGESVTLDFIDGTAVDGTYPVTVTGTNTFTVTSPVTASTTGTVGLDLRSFNAANVECTVIDPTTFTYFSPGFSLTSAVSFSSGKVDLGGLPQNRTYVYTWYTPWDEESIGSDPSDDLFIREGQTTTVSNIPTAPPAGNYNVRGLRLYRTVSSTSGTEYFKLANLWFPIQISAVRRTSNVSRVTTATEHNLSIDEYFKISGCTVASFDITGGIVTDVIDDYTFEYAQVAADVSSTPVVSGTIYHDVSQFPGTTPAQYWGDSTYDFTDNFDSRFLLDTLQTDEYDPPPANLKGLSSVQNNFLAGFVANEVYFSELNRPHAWPISYKVTLEHNVVAMTAVGGALFVATDAYPYILQTSDPAAGVSVQRIDLNYPCTNAKSMVTMEYGAVYATYEGLAVYSPFSGSQLLTKYNYDDDSWSRSLDPTTINGQFFGSKYIGSHSKGSFTFERDEKTGGIFTTFGNPTYYLLNQSGGQILQQNGFGILLNAPSPVQFTASYFDSVNYKLYMVRDSQPDVFLFDDITQAPLLMEWKSKVFKTKDMINLGAARVIADFTELSANALVASWDSITTNWENTTSLYEFSGQVTFYLWVNKELKAVRDLTSNNTFRLPTGYRADTFEFTVISTVRVREVHLAETPIGLKEA